MASDAIAVVRGFNRAYTQRIGALASSFLGTGLPLGAARMLFEIGTAGIGVRELRARLGLDSGYTSRLLRELEDGGLVTVVPDRDDARRRIAKLTARGRRTWNEIDGKSNALAGDLLDGLGERQRAQLVDALATAHRLVRLATVAFDVVDPRAPAAVAALEAYFAELDARFADGFEQGDVIEREADGYLAPRGAFVLARSDSETVACGGYTRLDAKTAEIKRMWVAPAWRGSGMGRRMLAALERLAVERGCRRIVLDTNSALDEAIALYRSSGYVETPRYNDNPYARLWFAKPVARVAGGRSRLVVDR